MTYSGIQWHTVAYSGIQWHTVTYSDIQDLKVLKDLRQIIMLHPHMKFYFLCNPPKTKQLEFCENAECVLFKDMERLKDG